MTIPTRGLNPLPNLQMSPMVLLQPVATTAPGQVGVTHGEATIPTIVLATPQMDAAIVLEVDDDSEDE